MTQAYPSVMLGERHSRSLAAYHQWQGQTNDCGPYVVTMAVNFWHGQTLLEAQAVARAMNRPRLGWGFPPVVVRRIPRWATFPWGIADLLRQHHLPARWRILASEKALQDALREGRLAMPILGEPWCLREGRWCGWAHVVILAGWDAASERYLLVDSSRTTALTSLPRAEFLRLWRAMGRLLVETR